MNYFYCDLRRFVVVSVSKYLLYSLSIHRITRIGAFDTNSDNCLNNKGLLMISFVLILE